MTQVLNGLCVCSLPSAVVPSPMPSMSSSHYKQCWWSSMHDTQHPIVLQLSSVLWCSFVFWWSLFKLRWSFVMLWLVLVRASTVLALTSTASPAIQRASLVIWRVSLAIRSASLALPQSSLNISSCALHETRYGQFVVVGVSPSHLYKPESSNTNTVSYYSVTGEK